MINEETNNKVKSIKRSFRLLMNGVASHSMREKGLSYKINWGIQFSDIKNLAGEYGKDYQLAIELWKENVRECKILATLIMPVEKMSHDLVNLWVEQTATQEIAEMAVFNLYQYLDFAPELAYEWVASENIYWQLSGFHLFARLFAKGRQPDERGVNEFIDQALVAFNTDNIVLKHAVANSVSHFCDLGETYEQIVRNVLPELL